MGAVVEIWFESLIPFLLKDSHIVHCRVYIYAILIVVYFLYATILYYQLNSTTQNTGLAPHARCEIPIP